MMTEMLEFYEANQGLPNPPFHELNKNAVFAVQHPEDKRWYRFVPSLHLFLVVLVILINSMQFNLSFDFFSGVLLWLY